MIMAIARKKNEINIQTNGKVEQLKDLKCLDSVLQVHGR